MFVNSNEEDKDFILLYRKYYPKIFNFFMRRFLNRELAEDFTSNTFFKAVRSLNKNSTEIKNFNAWIYKIATNEALSHLRYIKRKKRDGIEEDLNSIINIFNQNSNDDKNGSFIDFIALNKAMDHLKPQEKEIIDLYYFAKLDYSDISEILDMKETTLRSLLHRTLKKLEKLMKT